MDFSIKLSHKQIEINTKLDQIIVGDLVYLYKGLSKELATDLISAQKCQDINLFLNKIELPYFLFFVIDKKLNTISAYNDHFGSNEVYYVKNEDGWFLSNKIETLLPTLAESSIRQQSVYEMIVFQGVLPPETMFENVFCIPSGTALHFDCKTYTSESYWDVTSLLGNKVTDYDAQVISSDRVLKNQVKFLDKKTTAIALSGGVDSGGLLGMMREIHGYGVKTISIGGRGSDTHDLTSARNSAAFNKAEPKELYPEFADIQKMWRYTHGLSQPVSASTLFVYSLINDWAKEVGVSNVVYGFGAEMLLGNLRVAKIADKLRYESVIPKIILKPIYYLGVKILGFKKTHLEFLQSFSWLDRFMYVRGAHFTWERDYFTDDSISLWEKVSKKISAEDQTDLEVTDRLVLLYLKSWVNYLQARDITAFGQLTGVMPVIPFDSTEVARVFMQTSVRDRKRNNWNKQLIRDVMKPYVQDSLFKNPVRSLIVPYNDLFLGKTDILISYMKGSRIIGNSFDFSKIATDYDQLPEGGLFLMHILGVVVWYDSNYDTQRKSEFDALFN